MGTRALIRASDQPWAITEAALEQIRKIAAREDLDPEALAAKLGRPLQNTRTVEERDGIAIIPVIGPIFQRANLFTEVSGATSTEILATDFNAALDNPLISAIVMNYDTPGGELDGINELGQMIYDARGTKPIISYVGAQAASGGYWLASAADEIVADDTARIGSIGTVVSMAPPDEAGEQEIVSSQSPLKRAGPETDEGLAHIQGIVDDLADVFIGAVARNRNVDTDTVLSDFGRGGQMVAAKAVDAGMIDRLGSLESVISELIELREQASDQPGTAGPAIAAARSKTFGGRAANSTKGKKAMKKPRAAGRQEPPATDPEQSDQVRCPNCGTLFDPSQNAASAGDRDKDERACHEEGKEDDKEEKAAGRKQREEGKDPLDTGDTSGRAVVSAERTRIAAITGCDEAKGREELARTIALETDTTPEAAKKLLAAAPKKSAANPLAGAMSHVPNPDVGAGAGEGGSTNDAADEVTKIMALHKSLNGGK